MKKINSILVLLSLVGIITTSCMKDNDTAMNVEKAAVTENTSTAQHISRNKFSGSAFEGVFQLASNVGHKAADCGGKCKYMNGVYFHADCQGFGSTCTLRASISVSYTGYGNRYIAKGLNDYEPTDAVDFNMPDRSFYLGNDAALDGYCWLNIPEQVLKRDPITKQFIYNDLTFSKEQKYPNL